MIDSTHTTIDTNTITPLKDIVKQPNKTYTTYKVEKGDTLWSIAQRFQSVTVEDIKKENNLSSNDPLIIGKFYAFLNK